MCDSHSAKLREERKGGAGGRVNERWRERKFATCLSALGGRPPPPSSSISLRPGSSSSLSARGGSAHLVNLVLRPLRSWKVEAFAKMCERVFSLLLQRTAIPYTVGQGQPDSLSLFSTLLQQTNEAVLLKEGFLKNEKNSLNRRKIQKKNIFT